MKFGRLSMVVMLAALIGLLALNWQTGFTQEILAPNVGSFEASGKGHPLVLDPQSGMWALATDIYSDGTNMGIGTLRPQQKLTLGPGNNLATEMSTPVNVTVVAEAGGALSAGTYYFKAVASDGVGLTIGSSEVVCTVDGINTNRCALAWDAVPGASAYRVYKGSSPGNQDRFKATATNSYNYNTDAGATLGTVPLATTAYVNKLSAGSNSWVLGGNLGIGTSDPSVTLDVEGTVEFGTGGAQLLSTISDNFVIRTASDSPNPNFVIGIGNGTGVEVHQPIFWNAGALVLNGGGLSWCPSCVPNPDANHHVVIRESGNVGIGTPNPVGNLDIYDPESTAYVAQRFQVGESSGRIVFTGEDFGDTNYGTGDLTLQTENPGNNIRFATYQAIHAMIITYDGKVGIGTTNPTEALDVAGNIYASGNICDGSGCLLELRQQNEALQQENEVLRDEVDELEARLNALEQLLQELVNED